MILKYNQMSVTYTHALFGNKNPIFRK